MRDDAEIFRGLKPGLYKFGEVMAEGKLEVHSGMRTGTAESLEMAKTSRYTRALLGEWLLHLDIHTSGHNIFPVAPPLKAQSGTDCFPQILVGV